MKGSDPSDMMREYIEQLSDEGAAKAPPPEPKQEESSGE